jgi:HlyD family secretion protein
MKKIIIFSVIVIAAGFLIYLNLTKQDEGVKVTVEEVTAGVVQQKVSGSGQIQPESEVKVSAQVAGKIINLYAKEGDPVKKGDLLVELDPKQYKASLERQNSSLLAAKANEKKAKSELERSKKLFKQTLISKAELEAVEAGSEAAESQRLQAEASLREAEDALNKTRLFASMDGVVTRLNKEKGEMAIGAQFQEDIIMIVSDLSVMEALIEVDENDVINVRRGDLAQIELDAFPDSLFKGRVTQIANSAITRGLGTQEQVTNFEVTITLDEPDKQFRPGMSATVDILTHRLENVVKAPMQAVTVREKADSLQSNNKSEKMVEVVFVVEEKKAKMKTVILGISDDTHYAILKGLESGEKVITGPFKLLSKDLKNDQLVSEKKNQKKKR